MGSLYADNKEIGPMHLWHIDFMTFDVIIYTMHMHTHAYTGKENVVIIHYIVTMYTHACTIQLCLKKLFQFLVLVLWVATLKVGGGQLAKLYYFYSCGEPPRVNFHRAALCWKELHAGR